TMAKETPRVHKTRGAVGCSLSQREREKTIAPRLLSGEPGTVQPWVQHLPGCVCCVIAQKTPALSYRDRGTQCRHQFCSSEYFVSIRGAVYIHGCVQGFVRSCRGCVAHQGDVITQLHANPGGCLEAGVREKSNQDDLFLPVPLELVIEIGIRE